MTMQRRAEKDHGQLLAHIPTISTQGGIVKHIFVLLAIAMALLFAMPVAAAPPDRPAVTVDCYIGGIIAPFALEPVGPEISAPLYGSAANFAALDQPFYYAPPSTLAGLMSGAELPYYCASSSFLALDIYLTQPARLIAYARDQTFRT